MPYYQIQEFLGIQQQKDGNLLPSGSAYDARNMSTVDGNLSVAKGYEKHIPKAVPGNDRILKLIPARNAETKFYVVTAGNIYVFKNDAWTSIFTFSTALTSVQVDYLQTLIQDEDYVIVATGQSRMIKIKLSDDTAEEFGSGVYAFEGTVSAYNATTKVITPSAPLSTEAQRHAKIDGVTVAGTVLDVSEATATAITLGSAPAVAPAAGSAMTVRGGGSTACCNYLDMYYGRFFCAGDPDNPCRLYWSAVAGDSRTIEDWLSVEGSADASGGYVEVGDASGDAIVGIAVLSTQMLIFKRFSVYRLYGDRPSSYAVERVDNYTESMSNASVIIKYDAPYYLTMSGIKYYDGTGILPANSGMRYLKDFVSSIQSASESKGVYCDNHFYFTCKTKQASTYDDTVIVYDVARTAFLLRDGFQVADMCVHDGHIYLINEARYVYAFNKGTTYDGTKIKAYWKTQKTDLSAKYVTKQVREIYMRCSSGNMSIAVYADDAHKNIARQLHDDKSGYVNVHVDINKARLFSLEFSNVSGSAFQIKGGVELLFDQIKG